MPTINFFKEDVEFRLPPRAKTSTWLRSVIKKEGYTLKQLNFVFCSDKYLAEINLGYLKHDTYTDIITFDNSDSPKHVEGDIFISVERVSENAEKFQQPFTKELKRVMVHGVLHLLGYQDKTNLEKSTMREREDLYLGK
jgi:probable rRNA maturation factor